MYVHGSEERYRLLEETRWFRRGKYFEKIKEIEKIRRLGGERSSLSVFEAD